MGSTLCWTCGWLQEVQETLVHRVGVYHGICVWSARPAAASADWKPSTEPPKASRQQTSHESKRPS